MAFIGNTNTTQAFTPAVDYFSGNGSTTAFTLSRPVASVAQVQVTIDNVAQNPSSAYTISGSTITFTSAPLSGTNNIYVYYTSPITQVIAPGQGTVDATSLASSTGTGAVVLATSPTITTPTISSISSASATALTLKSAGTTAVTIDTSQNVGIGNTTPSSYNSNANKLVIGSNSAVTGMTLASGTTAAGNIFFARGTTGADAYDGYVQYAQNGQYMAFGTNGGAERMRIDSSGNLLVGVTTGTNGRIKAKQTISDNVLYLDGSNASPYGLQVYYSTAAPNGTGAEFIYCNDTSATRFVARSNGGLANYSANNVNLSDRREKTNFSPSKSYLDVICAIPVQTFNYIDQNMEEDAGLTLGVVAQDVQAVAPELVMESNWASRGEPEKMRLSIYQTDLQYALMKSIQELKAINDQQAETINALTARIEALENK
ncbi:hypothetical protein EBT25_09090 [bacterium]|nr:hypothetical protein [bacterium]